MRSLLILALTLASFSLYPFTLIKTKPHLFTAKQIPIHLIKDSCGSLGINSSEILSLATSAAELYWNSVLDIKIRLIRGKSGTYKEQNAIYITCSKDAAEFVSGNIRRNIHEITISSQKSKIENSFFKDLPYNRKLLYLAHGIGHAIGIGHSYATESIMGPTELPQTDALSQDDIAAIEFLYR